MKNESESKLILEILKKSRNIAVIGVKKSESESAYTVPLYMFENGYHIFPVNPKYAGEMLFNEKVFSNVTEITVPIELVNIFRRSEFVYVHAKEIITMDLKPRYVWFQEGIYNDEAAKLLEENGIKVIQDRCIMVEHAELL